MNLSSGKCKMLTLSDEVIVMILRHLSTSELIFTSRTCKRLKRLCFDKKLMQKIHHPPDDYQSMCQIFEKCINSQTTELVISSSNFPNPGNRCSVRPTFILDLSPIYSRFPRSRIPRALTRLSFINQVLDGRLIRNITMLPATLEVLDLSGTIVTHITEESQWFREMSLHFTQLEELILKHCSWVTTHSLLAISKCPKLISLNLEGCRNIGDSIAYCALVSMKGFANLKILNLNNTGIRESDLHFFCKISTLEELYFGKYYLVDREKSISDTSICFTIYQDCKNLRIMDISGCFLHDKERPHHTLLSLLSRETKLEKVIAYVMEPIPKMLLKNLKQIHPHLEIKQAVFL